MIVSVIICTYDPGAFLREQLAALNAQILPSELYMEVIIADNHPSGLNKSIVEEFEFKRLHCAYLHEKRVGKCFAANAGILASKGEVLIFTDDDVLPPPRWVTAMAEPILSGLADVVAGGVKIPEQLRSRLIGTAEKGIVLDNVQSYSFDEGLIGANMAISRRCLEIVRGFDPELGPGRLGCGEDSLFGMQLREAGYRFRWASTEGTVCHHFATERLKKSALIQYAINLGKVRAYLNHHWHHKDTRFPRVRLLISVLGLIYVRLRWANETNKVEGIFDKEMHQYINMGYFRHYIYERRRIRNYETHGLEKIAGVKDARLMRGAAIDADGQFAKGDH